MAILFFLFYWALFSKYLKNEPVYNGMFKIKITLSQRFRFCMFYCLKLLFLFSSAKSAKKESQESEEKFCVSRYNYNVFLSSGTMEFLQLKIGFRYNQVPFYRTYCIFTYYMMFQFHFSKFYCIFIRIASLKINKTNGNPV